MNKNTGIKRTSQKELVVQQLKTTPIVQIACSKCDVSRASFYRWLKDDPEFASEAENAIEEGTNIINDLAESQLVTFIKDGNLQAILYWLNHRHTKYKNKLELTTQNGTGELTPEQQEDIKNALVLASLIKLENNGDQNEKTT